MSELRLRRHSERGGADAERVDTGEDRADDAVLTGRIESLEHDQDAPRALGVEPLLELRQPVPQIVEAALRRLLVLEPEVVPRVAHGDLGRRSGRNAQRVDHAATLLVSSRPECSERDEPFEERAADDRALASDCGD